MSYMSSVGKNVIWPHLCSCTLILQPAQTSLLPGNAWTSWNLRKGKPECKSKTGSEELIRHVNGTSMAMARARSSSASTATGSTGSSARSSSAAPRRRSSEPSIRRTFSSDVVRILYVFVFFGKSILGGFEKSIYTKGNCMYFAEAILVGGVGFSA